MKKIIFSFTLSLLFLINLSITAQIRPVAYIGNGHSHNDYKQNNPFTLAYSVGFGSIEVDLFLKNGELYVAHDFDEINEERTFDKLYLQPILEAFRYSEDGYLYPNQGQLQLLIDPKTDGGPILKVLTEKLTPYRDYFDSKNNAKAVKLVISGKKPRPEDFDRFDEIFFFDGDLGANYTADQLARIGLFSAPLSSFSQWNGLGRFTNRDLQQIVTVVDSVHQLGKKIRFWGTPDTKTTWQEWIKIGIDYINTDDPVGVGEFVRKYPHLSHQENTPYETYHPKRNFKHGTNPQNIILLISDGAGLSQLWAAATANRGALHVMNMPYTGYMMTGSIDNYHTDSAAGGSALATGVKTRNRSIGVDSLGTSVENIPDILANKGIISGIVSNDRVTGATPSSFYTHVSERDMTDSIAYDLLDSKLSLVIGGFHSVFAKEDSTLLHQLRKKEFEIQHGVHSISNTKSKRILAFAEDKVSKEWDKLSGDQEEINTSYRMIEETFPIAVNFLKKQSADKGFFLMVEGAKIDGGGHSNSLPFTVSEYLSFDRMVGQALEYADKDGQTLVIVTSDHETGGLVVLDGNYKSGQVLGHFATTDHTGVPVPIAAYGPGAELFQGFKDNTEIAKSIYKLFDIK